MDKNFHTRFLFRFVLSIVIVLLCLGLLLANLFKESYMDIFNNRMEKEARIVSLIKEDGLSHTTKEQLQGLSESLGINIIVFREKGTLLFDTSGTFKWNDEFRKYTEKWREPYFVIDDIYYSIFQSGEETILIGTSRKAFTQFEGSMWGGLVILIAGAIAIILLILYRVMKKYTEPLQLVTKIVEDLERGDYQARINSNMEIGLIRSLNTLAENLQSMIRVHQIEHDQMRTLIENMGSSLILIDGNGRIYLVNQTFQETFRINADDYLKQPYHEVFRHSEMVDLVEEVFRKEVALWTEIELLIERERKYFQVYTAPILGNRYVWEGVVLVFHDKTKLTKLEQSRKDFVASVSHELNTPITSIRGFAETLLDGAIEDTKMTEKFLTIILNESERMQHLVKDLLELSKIEQQGYRLRVAMVNIQEIMEEVFVILKDRATEKNLELWMGELNFFIEGDFYRLQQVFLNLVNNAIQYTGRYGSIHVTLEQQEEYAIVHVKDTGIGISEEDHSRIFERFYRVDKARSRESGGTGLGLAIVKNIVDAHHGDISMESIVGVGTKFSVMLKKYNYFYPDEVEKKGE